MAAPERIWTCNETRNIWVSEKQDDTTEYVRADLARLSLPVSNTDIDRTSEPEGHWEDGGKVWVEDHDCSLPVSKDISHAEAMRLLRTAMSALMIADRSRSWANERDKLVAEISELLQQETPK